MEEGQKSSNPTFTKPQSIRENEVTFPRPKKGRQVNKTVIYAIVLIVLAITVVVAFMALGNRNGDVADEVSVSPTPTLMIQPTSTPTQEPQDKTQLKVQLLNGTGIAGEAAYLQNKFEGLDYGDISVSNADTSDYAKTEVSFSGSIDKTIRDEVISQLEEIYNDVEVVDGQEGSFDIKVIIGYRKGHTSTPTKAPTGTDKPTPTSTSSAQTAQ